MMYLHACGILTTFMHLDRQLTIEWKKQIMFSFIYAQCHVFVAVMQSLSLAHLLTVHSIEDKLRIPIRDKA
jgi:hypothetical protein